MKFLLSLLLALVAIGAHAVDFSYEGVNYDIDALAASLVEVDEAALPAAVQAALAAARAKAGLKDNQPAAEANKAAAPPVLQPTPAPAPKPAAPAPQPAAPAPKPATPAPQPAVAPKPAVIAKPAVVNNTGNATVNANATVGNSTNATVSVNATGDSALNATAAAAKIAAQLELVKTAAAEAAQKNARKQIAADAPVVYKRIVSLEEMEAARTTVSAEVVDKLRSVAPLEGVPVLEARKFVRDAGARAAEIIATKAGLGKVTQKNNKVARASLDTVRRILRDAVEAGVQAGVKSVEGEFDEMPDFTNALAASLEALPDNNGSKPANDTNSTANATAVANSTAAKNATAPVNTTAKAAVPVNNATKAAVPVPAPAAAPAAAKPAAAPAAAAKASFLEMDAEAEVEALTQVALDATVYVALEDELKALNMGIDAASLIEMEANLDAEAVAAIEAEVAAGAEVDAEAELDAEVDMEAEMDAEMDLEADLEADADEEADVDADADADVEEEGEADAEADSEDVGASLVESEAEAESSAPALDLGIPNAPVTDNERRLKIQQWLNVAAAAPANQKLWTVYQDGSGDLYYANTVTNEVTWAAPSEADKLKPAREFSAESDIPKAWGVWKDNFITRVLTDKEKPRDWCNPMLCKNGVPCVNGKCQCGLMFEGDMCEKPSQLAKDLRFKQLNDKANVDPTEALRKQALIKQQEKAADLRARTLPTSDVGEPQQAIAAEGSYISQSLLDPVTGRFDPKATIGGPENPVEYLPSISGAVDHALMYQPPHASLPSAPGLVRRAVVVNRRAYDDAATAREWVAKNGAASLPNVNATMVRAYVKPAPAVAAVPEGIAYAARIQNSVPAKAPEPVVFTSLV